MDIQVSVTQILPQQSGVGNASGKSWTKDQFIGETNDQFPKKITFAIFNSKTYIPQIGDTVIVSFDLVSRPFTGRDGVERWSTDVIAYAIAPATPVQAASPAGPTAPVPGAYPPGSSPVFGGSPAEPIAPNPDNDLPF